MNLSTLITHLEAKTGTLINVDLLHPALYSSEALKLPVEQQIHRSVFCEFAKRHSKAEPTSCFERKKETRAMASKGVGICATCPFGIQEWIQPVMFEGEHAATLYLGPFAGEDFQRKIGRARFRGDSPPDLPPSLEQLQNTATFLAEVIRTEIELWLATGNTLGKQKPGSFYRDFAIRYIDGNYREDTQIIDLAQTLKMSPNYVSARIRKECGKTFRQLLTEKRIAVACTCLEFERDLSVTDIAFQVGYNDSNYFSTVFRKQIGVSPKAYRQGKRGRTQIGLTKPV